MQAICAATEEKPWFCSWSRASRPSFRRLGEIVQRLERSIQVGGPGCDDELVCEGGKDGREFLTPSPTGPLDSHGFFDEPMESSLGTAVYC